MRQKIVRWIVVGVAVALCVVGSTLAQEEDAAEVLQRVEERPLAQGTPADELPQLMLILFSTAFLVFRLSGSGGVAQQRRHCGDGDGEHSVVDVNRRQATVERLRRPRLLAGPEIRSGDHETHEVENRPRSQ